MSLFFSFTTISIVGLFFIASIVKKLMEALLYKKIMGRQYTYFVADITPHFAKHEPSSSLFKLFVTNDTVPSVDLKKLVFHHVFFRENPYSN